MALDTNDNNAMTAEVVLTDESVVSLYVLPASGSHARHRVVLLASPDGTKFRRVGQPVRGIGIETFIVAAQKVKAKVTRPEGSTSTCDVFLIAR